MAGVGDEKDFSPRVAGLLQPGVELVIDQPLVRMLSSSKPTKR